MKNYLLLPFIAFINIAVSLAFDGTESDYRKWASTPPLGWNSWDCYGSSVEEHEVIANAEYMRDNLKEYGWEYIVVDIRWYISNPKPYYNVTDQIYNLDEYGRYVPPVNRFPSAADGNGFKALAEKIHGMGLKFGIHIMRGVPIEAAKQKLPVKDGNGITCDMISNNDSACFWLYDNYKVLNTNDGQLYYNSIFDLYAEWGVDYVKIDDISRPVHKGEISMIRKAIDQCGRTIVLSLSPGKTDITQAGFIADNANMWRMTDDLWDRWTDIYSIFTEALLWSKYYRPGCYPDADMIPIGRLDYSPDRSSYRDSRLSTDEKKTLMNLWGIIHSPFMYGGHMPGNTDYELDLMTNADLIEMNRYGMNARQVSNNYGKIVWSSINPANGDHYAALFNVKGSSDSWYSPEGALHISDIIAYTTTGFSEEVEIEIPENTYILTLLCDDSGDGNSYDHGNWINPRYILEDGSELQVDCVSDVIYTNTEHAYNGFQFINPNKNLNGGKLKVNGIEYETGFSCHASSLIALKVPTPQNGLKIKKFKVMCGIDDSATGQNGFTSTMKFMVFNFDPTPRDICEPAVALSHSGLITRNNNINGVDLKADITGVSKLQLVVTNGNDNFAYDRANLVNPVIVDKNGNELSLTELQPESFKSDFGNIEINRNVEGGKLNIGGVEFSKGLGVNGQCVIVYSIPEDKDYITFKTKVGLDYSVVKDTPVNDPNMATVEFMVFGDVMHPNSTVPIALSLTEIGFEENQECLIKDMWSKEEIGIFKNDEFQPVFGSHQSGLYCITPLHREKVNSLTIKSRQINNDSAYIEVIIDGKTDQNSFVQILCNEKVVGNICAKDCSSVIYLATGMNGKYTFRALFSGNSTTASCESEPVEVDFSHDATGINENVCNENEDMITDIYSIDGRKLCSQVKKSEVIRNLPMGIYVIGCKKVMVK